jgi:signal transduction histidine kinase
MPDDAVDRRSADRLAALHRVTTSLLGSRDRDDLLELIVDQAVRLVGAERGVLRLLDQSSGLLTPVHQTRQRGVEALYSAMPPGVALAGRAFSERRAIWTDDYSSADGALEVAIQHGVRAVIAVPVLVGDEAVGVISVTSHQPGFAFDHGDPLLLELFASQVAVALHNARLVDLQRRQSERLMAVQRVGTSLLSNVRRDELLDTIVRQGVQVVDAEFGILLLLDESRTRLTPVHIVAPVVEGPPLATFPADAGVAGVAMSTRRPQIVNDYPRHPAARDEALDYGIRAIVAAPLLVAGEPIGVLELATAKENASFSEADAGLLELLASQAAVALENTRLFELIGEAEGLRELDRLKTEFLSTVSHELRTPLSYIHGYAELLMRRTYSADEIKEMAQEIHRGSTSMIRLVDDLLDLSRIESGQLALRPRPMDIAVLLSSIAAAFRAQEPDRPIEVIPPRTQFPAVTADPERIRQVISNLVSNAIRYSPVGTPVTLSAEANGSSVVVRVRDSGPGIAPDERHRVFERFYRGSAAALSAQRGTGLGLAIVKHLVEAHEGTVGVESEPGRGSTFWFSLPTTSRPTPR